MKGQIIGGDAEEIRIRQKAGTTIELGELLVAEKGSMLLQVFDLQFGSQLSSQTLELAAGLSMDDPEDIRFLDAELRHYTLASAKPLLSLSGRATPAKQLPVFFSPVRSVKATDLGFLEHPRDGVPLGKLRSGSQDLDISVELPGRKTLTHHVLISGSTGKGKSVLMKNLLWDLLDKEYCGLLVLDPHDEYYGKDGPGLKDHPDSKQLVYYGVQGVPPGQCTLKLHLSLVKPEHLSFLGFTDAQQQVLHTYYRRYGKDWISQVFLGSIELPKQEFQEVSLAVVRRKLKLLLDLDVIQGKLVCSGVFDQQAGQTTIHDIVDALEQAKTVIIDTSLFSGNTELLIGSLVSAEVLARFRKRKQQGTLARAPVVSIVLEEAPRVLGKDVLDHHQNIFATIAREGRKFQVGLVAITQLPSLIPKEVLANMNTKIILGTEMGLERQALIESAAQDLRKDQRAIASLDKGEAIVTSTFAKFALPLSIPFFDQRIRERQAPKTQNSFAGVGTS